MELLFVCLGILCLAYYGILFAVGMDFSFLWLMLGVLLTLSLIHI